MKPPRLGEQNFSPILLPSPVPRDKKKKKERETPGKPCHSWRYQDSQFLIDFYLTFADLGLPAARGPFGPSRDCPIWIKVFLGCSFAKTLLRTRSGLIQTCPSQSKV